jgi:hypothetical protein
MLKAVVTLMMLLLFDLVCVAGAGYATIGYVVKSDGGVIVTMILLPITLWAGAVVSHTATGLFARLGRHVRRHWTFSADRSAVVAWVNFGLRQAFTLAQGPD